jgi:PKD repeat protein
MNKLTQGEEFLKEQIAAFEFPYDETAWLKLDSALPRKGYGNFMKWASGFAVFTAAVVATVYFLNTENINTPISKSKTENTNGNITVINNQTDNSSEVTTNEQISAQTTQEHSANIQPIQNKPSSGNNILPQTVYTNDTSATCPKANLNNEGKAAKTPCPEFSYSASAGCPPFTVQFTPGVKCDSMIYSWDFGDGKLSTEKQPAHTFEKTGKYTVRLTVKYFRSEEIKTKVIENAVTVYAKPKAKFDFFVNDNKVSLQTSMTGHSFTWIANDTVSQGTTADRVIMKNGNHPVTFIATNPSGCSDTLQKKVNVNVPLKIFIANIFSPDGDGMNDTFGPITENNDITSYHLEIISSLGQPVFSKKGLKVEWDGINQNTKQLCEAGLYHYKLKIWDKFGNFEQMNGSVTLK